MRFVPVVEPVLVEERTPWVPCAKERVEDGGVRDDVAVGQVVERLKPRGQLAVEEHLLVFCNITNKIRKRTDTTVAFTQEYSRVSYPLGM